MVHDRTRRSLGHLRTIHSAASDGCMGGMLAERESHLEKPVREDNVLQFIGDHPILTVILVLVVGAVIVDIINALNR